MLLTIKQTGPGADDLSWLLHKHPDKAQVFPLGFGKAHVFFTEAEAAATEAALLLEIDPIDMVRNNRAFATAGHPLSQYVNDRPYVASSLLCVALREVFGTALAGNCKDRPDAVEVVRPLEISLAALPCEGGEALLRRIFEPLGYQLTCESALLDPEFPEWGLSPYLNVRLSGKASLTTALSHLYVLIPVMDNDKHYWIGDDEVDKLLRHGEGWLDSHPEKELIMRRYLGNRNHLYQASVQQLAETQNPSTEYDQGEAAEAEVERPISLNEQRLTAVQQALKSTGARTVIDLGCGEGKLLLQLATDPQFTKIAGVDVAMKPLQIASRKFNQQGIRPELEGNILLFPASFLYRDERLQGYDACVLQEVIEHQEPNRLRTLSLSVFGAIKPPHCVITTPNAEYNVRFDKLPHGKFRHPDHRFEWTRAQFQDWAHSVAQEFDYTVEFRPIGPEDAEVGAPTQMAIFHSTTSQKAN